MIYPVSPDDDASSEYAVSLFQRSTSPQSHTGRNATSLSIAEDDSSPQLIEDASFAEEPESDPRLLQPPTLATGLPPRSPISPPHSPVSSLLSPAGSPPRSPVLERPSKTPPAAGFGHGRSFSASVRRAASTREWLNPPPISTSRSLPASPPQERQPRRGPMHKPTLLTALTVATPSAATAANVEVTDPVALDQIWQVYADEAAVADRKMLAGWHRSLDVRLLFSGIFSAIVTPFIIESYKLLEIPGPSPAYFGTNGYRIRINAMWFGSLMMSLIAALLSIHCKQWLDGYSVDLLFADPQGPRESLRRACRLRQYRYQGLQAYGVPQIIGLLPVLLYLALLFFAVGLIDFLWHLNEGIAIYVTLMCLVVVLFHICTTALPFFTTRTPFRTPLSNLLGNLWRGARERRFALRGLIDEEELADVEARGGVLDAGSFEWLQKNTRAEDVYELAVRAQREFARRERAALAEAKGAV